MADFVLLQSPKLISRKIWVIGKSWNFHSVITLKFFSWKQFSLGNWWFHENFVKVFVVKSDAIKVRSLKVQCSLNGFWKNMYQQSLEKMPNSHFTLIPFKILLALKQVICTSIVHRSTIWYILLQCCQLIPENSRYF